MTKHADARPDVTPTPRKATDAVSPDLPAGRKKFEPEERGDTTRCLDCGAFMSRLVPQGLHAVLWAGGVPRNCAGEVVEPERPHSLYPAGPAPKLPSEVGDGR